ncbi:uncharacterized protein SCHCODRAFT_01088449 [Schizophyllum commune H4-8]|nr:uncharacterized protein SCHCODRAFT_01088449 [Schizophyllum commune H4-8]KAI5895492.1 hypothetical protein SCHCODRAFT_01088449 [Schizophyllum commune H4-8]
MSSNTAPRTAPATFATTAPNDELTAAVDKLALLEDSATTSAAPAPDPTTTLPTSSTPDPNPWRTMTPGIPPTSATETVPSESTTPNPWQAPTPTLPQEPTAVADPATLDPELRNSAAAFGGAQKTVTSEQEKEILAAFDPYARVESEEQRKAWDDARTSQDEESKDGDAASVSKAEAGVEGEPPATPSKADAPPEPPSKTHTPSSSASGFPSLNFSSIARSFSISSLSKDKGRPVSLDAKAQPDNVDARTVSQEQQDSGQQGNELRPSNDGNTAGSTQNQARQDDGEPPPFDFQRFLEQMNSKSAEPVSKYLKSFLSNFAKRTFTVNDQIKIINDFLNFIAQRMRQTDPWRKCTEQEFDNAMEGMEKLVMNRLYDFTFTPSIPTLQPPRPVTTDDLERDRVLAQRIALFGWVEEKHLDIDLTSEEGDTSSAKGFLMFAQQELLKMNHYKAPRDKVICILNCCKVIFGLIRHLKKDESADAFIPLLIFVVLKANPEHLLSNMEFIQRFRNPAKLQSEAGYYLSSLMGAVSFIETMDHTSLSNITQEEFEKWVDPLINKSVAEFSQERRTSHPVSSSSRSVSTSPLFRPTVRVVYTNTPEDAVRPLRATAVFLYGLPPSTTSVIHVRSLISFSGPDPYKRLARRRGVRNTTVAAFH